MWKCAASMDFTHIKAKINGSETTVAATFGAAQSKSIMHLKHNKKNEHVLKI